MAWQLAAGGDEFRIDEDKYPMQFCADVPADEAALMAVMQRPVTERAVSGGLSVSRPGRHTAPSWFVFGELDLTIPPAAPRFMAERAGALGTREVRGASHAVAVSRPDEVTVTILDAVPHVSGR
ncbi:alpha/beta fold hydrolase [Streptomyces sp. NPDC013178]|uniref:alpha/beta fold hydrolase n=1 Tax=Streptomyces sp. NPDC013178 TaxID=3155118 RepID=UPI003409578F